MELLRGFKYYLFHIYHQRSERSDIVEGQFISISTNTL